MKFLKLTKSSYSILRVLLLTTFISVVVYYDFIFGEKLYIFKDIGADTQQAYLPYILHFKELFSEFSFYSFNFGLGDSVLNISSQFVDIFNYLFLFVDNEDIPSMFVYIMILKHIFAALFFYLFVKKIGFNEFTALLVGLIYAYSGYIVVWGQHYGVSTYIVYLALLLYSFERYIQYNKTYLFIFALFLNILKIYFFYQASLFLFFYLIFRIYYLGISFKNIFKVLIILLLVVLLSSALLLPIIGFIIDSPRVNGSFFSLEYLKLYEIVEYYFILFFRFFSTDIFGSGNSFSSTYTNYYEAPIIYSGLLFITILPFSFLNLNKKLRYIFSISAVLIFCLLFVTFFISYFNGFSNLSHRYLFLLNIIILLMTARALDNINKIKYYIYIYYYLFLLFIVSVVYYYSPIENLEINILYISFIFIFIYMLILYYKYKYLLLFLVVFELIVFTHFSLKDRILVNKGEMEAISKNTINAIEYIKSIDNSKFYRIEKTYRDFGLNDQVYQNYFGTKQYSAILSKSFLDIHDYFGLKTDIHNRKTQSISSSPQLLSILGVKYIISKDKLNLPNYEQIKYDSKIKIYKNIHPFELGVAYTSYIDSDDVKSIDPKFRDTIIMENAIVNNVDKQNYLDIKKEHILISSKLNKYKVIKYKNLFILEKNIDSISYKPKNDDPQIILELIESIKNDSKSFVSFGIDGNIDSRGSIYYGTSGFSASKVIHFPIYKNIKNYKVYLNNINAKIIRIDVGVKNKLIKLSNIKINSKKINYAGSSSIKNFNIESFFGDNIIGSIKLDKSSIVVFSIPYDSGWKCFVDSKRREIFKLNSAFLGLPIEKGKHSIELVYVPNNLYLGIFLSSAGLLLLLLLHKISFLERKNVREEIDV